MRRHVYRLVVDRWPTPDGQPFRDQPVEFWEGVVDAWVNARSDDVPPWLPDDFESWLPDDGPFGVQPSSHPGFTFSYSEDPEPQTGYAGYFTPLVTVPCAVTRRFFTSRIPLERLATLCKWGCAAHVERAQIGDWEAVPHA